jgi:hypothetical protein
VVRGVDIEVKTLDLASVGMAEREGSARNTLFINFPCVFVCPKPVLVNDRFAKEENGANSIGVSQHFPHRCNGCEIFVRPVIDQGLAVGSSSGIIVGGGVRAGWSAMWKVAVTRMYCVPV